MSIKFTPGDIVVVTSMSYMWPRLQQPWSSAELKVLRAANSITEKGHWITGKTVLLVIATDPNVDGPSEQLYYYVMTSSNTVGWVFTSWLRAL